MNVTHPKKSRETLCPKGLDLFKKGLVLKAFNAKTSWSCEAIVHLKEKGVDEKAFQLGRRSRWLRPTKMVGSL